MKIKIFCTAHHFNRYEGFSVNAIDDLQKRANEFMTEGVGRCREVHEVHDIKFQVQAISEDYLVWSLLVLYK